LGHTVGDWTIDFAYMALFFEDRSVDNDSTFPQNPEHDGTYENMAHLWAFSFGRKW
jgi:long-subunit fatty acid transport protein